MSHLRGLHSLKRTFKTLKLGLRSRSSGGKVPAACEQATGAFLAPPRPRTERDEGPRRSAGFPPTWAATALRNPRDRPYLAGVRGSLGLRSTFAARQPRPPPVLCGDRGSVCVPAARRIVDEQDADPAEERRQVTSNPWLAPSNEGLTTQTQSLYAAQREDVPMSGRRDVVGWVLRVGGALAVAEEPICSAESYRNTHNIRREKGTAGLSSRSFRPLPLTRILSALNPHPTLAAFTPGPQSLNP